METAQRIFVIGTADTKKAEILFVAEQLGKLGHSTVTVDISVNAGPGGACGLDVPPEAVCPGAPFPWESEDRGSAVSRMGQALREFLVGRHQAGQVAGVIGLGGSGGTALCSAGFTALPLGVPKFIVSTMASGDTRGYVGETDLVLIPALVDLAGVNRVSAGVLTRAAGALSGMIRANAIPIAQSGRPLVGATMFGVTTPCVTRARELLEKAGMEVLVFHATGAGGRAMENLVEANLLEGVLDVTTTEVADEVVGGVLTAGPKRMDIILEKRLPYVLSLGALDMVNFGARHTVPEKFTGRLFHEHNAHVTLMRTTPEENRSIGAWIGRKLERAAGPWTVVIPWGGVSALDSPGKTFHNPEALNALIQGLKGTLSGRSGHTVVESPLHVNDPAFAELLVAEYLKLCPARNRN